MDVRWLVIVGSVVVAIAVTVLTPPMAPEPEVIVVPGVEIIRSPKPAREPAQLHVTQEHPPDCVIREVLPFERWDIADDHFGPLSACAPIDAEALRRVLPDFEVVWQSKEDAPLIVLDGKTTVMEVSSSGAATIELFDRRPLTPWGIRVGDSLDALRARHRDLECEGDVCRRPPTAGWPDSLSYRIAGNRIATIVWTLRAR